MTISKPAASLRHSPTAASTRPGLRIGVETSRFPDWMWEDTSRKLLSSSTARARSIFRTRLPTLTARRKTTYAGTSEHDLARAHLADESAHARSRRR